MGRELERENRGKRIGEGGKQGRGGRQGRGGDRVGEGTGEERVG